MEQSHESKSEQNYLIVESPSGDFINIPTGWLSNQVVLATLASLGVTYEADANIYVQQFIGGKPTVLITANDAVVANIQQQNGGSERSGLDNANIIVGATGIVPSTIEMGTVLIKQSANYTDDIAKVAKISSRTATGLGVVSMVITTMDGATSQGGWKNHHTADLIIGGAQTFLLGTGPVGWGIGLVWLTADLITTGVTGKSITENLFD